MLSLTTAEQVKLANASRLLISPLEMGNLDEWYGAISRSLKDLLCAERSILSMPFRNDRRFFTKDADIQEVTNYPERVGPLASKASAWDRVVRLGAYHRSQLWRPVLDEYFSSAYYHDYILPLRLFEPIGLGVAVGGRPSASTVCQFQFYADREGAAAFGERGALLLRMLLPAYEAGIRVCRRLEADRSMLASALDAVRDGVLLCDHSGAVLHQNTALLAALEREPDRDRLRGALHAVVRSVSGLIAAKSTAASSLAMPLVREFRSPHVSYRLCGTVVKDYLGGRATVMVSVERLTPEPLDPNTLMARYGLTRRGAEVAVLVSDGLGNDEIATRLGISVHTARHHVEAVMARLDVTSRASIARKLFS